MPICSSIIRIDVPLFCIDASGFPVSITSSSQLPTLSDAAVAQLLLEWCQPWKGRTYSILDKDHQPYPQLIQWGYWNGYSGASDLIYQLSTGIQIFKSNHFGRHPIGYMAIGYKHLSILIDNTFPPLIEFYPTLLHGKYGRSTTSEGEQLSSPSTSFLLHQRHKDRRGGGGGGLKEVGSWHKSRPQKIFSF